MDFPTPEAGLSAWNARACCPQYDYAGVFAEFARQNGCKEFRAVVQDYSSEKQLEGYFEHNGRDFEFYADAPVNGTKYEGFGIWLTGLPIVPTLISPAELADLATTPGMLRPGLVYTAAGELELTGFITNFHPGQLCPEIVCWAVSEVERAFQWARAELGRDL